jgi:hypothetical protein
MPQWWQLEKKLYFLEVFSNDNLGTTVVPKNFACFTFLDKRLANEL